MPPSPTDCPGRSHHSEEVPSADIARRISHSSPFHRPRVGPASVVDQCGVVRGPPYAHLLPHAPPPGESIRPFVPWGRTATMSPASVVRVIRVWSPRKATLAIRPGIPGSGSGPPAGRSTTYSGRTMIVAGPSGEPVGAADPASSRDREDPPAVLRRDRARDEIRLAHEVWPRTGRPDDRRPRAGCRSG